SDPGRPSGTRRPASGRADSGCKSQPRGVRRGLRQQSAPGMRPTPTDVRTRPSSERCGSTAPGTSSVGRTRGKGRNLAHNASCTLTARLPGVDLMFVGEAHRVTEPTKLRRVAEAYRRG